MTRVAINLIPASVLAQRQAGRWRARWAMGLGVAALVLTGAGAALRMGTGDRIEAMRAERARLESQLRTLDATLPSLRANVAVATRTAGAATVLSDRPDWSMLLAMLDRERGEGVVLDAVSVRGLDAAGKPSSDGAPASVRVHIEGFAQSQGVVQAYVLSVERSGVFDRVQPLGTSPRRLGTVEGVAFQVDCQIGSLRTAGVTP